MKKTSIPRVLVLCTMMAAPVVAAEKDSPFRVRGDVLVEYTDNLFHYSDSRLDHYDAESGTNERFESIESTDDVVTRLRARIDYTWMLGKKRDVRAMLNPSYFVHDRNSIADYAEVEAGLLWDVTRRDHLDLVVDQIIDRFKKNYHVADSMSFDAAAYDQTDAVLGYTRDLTKKGWDLGVDYKHRRRTFNDVFRGREYDGDYVQVHTSYGVSKNARASTAVGYGEADSRTEMDLGILIDRSYDQFLATQAFDFGLGAHVDLALLLAYRRREYTTDVTEDVARHDRVDDRYSLQVRVDKGWKNGLTLRIEGALVNNDSNQEEDVAVEPDETGYDERTAAVGLVYRF